MKYLLFSLLILLSCCELTGQSGVPVPGYYVELSGDTVYAKIELSGDAKLSHGIKVWPTGNAADFKQIEAKDLMALGFPAEERFYRSIDHEVNGVDDPSIKKTVRKLARVVIDDEVQLYELTISNLEQGIQYVNLPPFIYYLVTEDGTSYRLDQEEKKFDGGQFQVIKKYQGTLRYALRDWAKIEFLAFETRFSRTALERLVLEYLDDFYPAFQHQSLINQKKAKTKVTPEIRLLGASWYRREGLKADARGFGGGLFFQFRRPEISSGLVIGLGVELLIFTEGEANPSANRIAVNEGYLLRVPLDIKLLLSQSSNWQPYLNGGISVVPSANISGNLFPAIEEPIVRFHVGLGIDYGRIGLFYRRGSSILNTFGASCRL